MDLMDFPWISWEMPTSFFACPELGISMFNPELGVELVREAWKCSRSPCPSEQTGCLKAGEMEAIVAEEQWPQHCRALEWGSTELSPCTHFLAVSQSPAGSWC